MGGIGYAYDLTQLTPTWSVLKVLIEICEEYADDYCVKFNNANSRVAWGITPRFIRTSAT